MGVVNPMAPLLFPTAKHGYSNAHLMLVEVDDEIHERCVTQDQYVVGMRLILGMVQCASLHFRCDALGVPSLQRQIPSLILYKPVIASPALCSMNFLSCWYCPCNNLHQWHGVTCCDKALSRTKTGGCCERVRHPPFHETSFCGSFCASSRLRSLNELYEIARAVVPLPSAYARWSLRTSYG